MTCKEPNAPATRKQTWALYCIYKKDYRNEGLTRQEASDLINQANGKKAATSKKASGKKVIKKTAKKNPNQWALDLLKDAVAKGEESLAVLIDSKKVKPMVVQQHANPMNDNSPVTEQWVVPGGPCGFASIRVKCTNGPSRKFINQLKKAGLAGDRNSHCEWSKSDYYGGYMKSFTMIGGQSIAYKTAYAYGFESVLCKAGINTWVWTKMD